MDREALSEALRELYNDEVGASLDVLGDDVRLIADLGLDSVDVLSLIMQVERHFRIRLTRTEIQSVAVVGDLLDLVAIKLRESANRAA